MSLLFKIKFAKTSSMTISNNAYIGILAVACVGIILFIYYVYKLQKPSSGSCDIIKDKNPNIKWSDDCTFVQEITQDSSIITPKNPLYLTKFTSSPSLGPPWGVNVWYAYKYVNGKTGGYGALSPWTSSPISSGSNNLPCKGGNCSPNFQFASKDSCQSNLPELQIDSLDYDITSGYYVNVHRYVTDINDNKPPSSQTQGKIVGMIIQTTKGGKFIDVSKSPCLESNCQNIQGC